MFIVITSILAFFVIVVALWEVSAFVFNVVEHRYGDRMAGFAFMAVWMAVFLACFIFGSEDSGIPVQYLTQLLEGY